MHAQPCTPQLRDKQDTQAAVSLSFQMNEIQVQKPEGNHHVLQKLSSVWATGDTGPQGTLTYLPLLSMQVADSTSFLVYALVKDQRENAWMSASLLSDQVLHWTVLLDPVSLQNFLYFPAWYMNKHFKLWKGLCFCSFAYFKYNNLCIYTDMRPIVLLISYNVTFKNTLIYFSLLYSWTERQRIKK